MSMKWVSKEEGIFLHQKKMRLRIFLRDWNDFTAKTEFGIVSEYFCIIEVGLRLFLSEEKREEHLDLEIFWSKNQKGEKDLDLK